MVAIADALATALQHQQAGRKQAAEQIYRGILQDDPRQPDAWHLLGLLAHEMGQSGLAIEYIQRAIRLKYHASAFHNNLGVVYRASGKLTEAVASYRQAIALQRDYADAHNNLGNALRDQHKPEEAIASFRQALKFRPQFAEAHNNLGNALRDVGQLDLAIASYRRAIGARPDYAKAHLNLGAVYKDQGQLEAAIDCFHKALELKPDFAEAHNNLGFALREQGKLDEAEACCRRALELDSELAEAHINLGNVLRLQGQIDEAVDCYRRALAINSDFAEAHSNLGDALIEFGLLPQAEASFRLALKLRPDFGPALSGLAMLLRGKLPDADLAALEQQIAQGRANDGLRAELLFALAHVLDARGQYARAAENLSEANALRLKLAAEPYEPAAHDRFIGKLFEVFDRGFFERLAGGGLDSAQPVFVFGLPRSGTTLIEQILASHSQVYGAGEVQLARDSFEALPGLLERKGGPLDCVPYLDPAALQRLGERHLAGLAAADKRGAKRVVDKMPENYLFLGLLAVMFPRATFIHCRRDLRDVAVSCWMTDFHDVPWSNAHEHIASRFHDYRRTMEHWRGLLPVTIHDAVYEETVTDLEGVARRLIAACGLEWEPACLDFHRTSRPIRTASVSQVRQPVYQKSIGRWQHYELALADLLARLPASAG